jgi:hypothetical protein
MATVVEELVKKLVDEKRGPKTSKFQPHVKFGLPSGVGRGRNS